MKRTPTLSATWSVPYRRHQEERRMQSNKITLGKSNLAILSGEADLSLWTEEELIRGQRRAANGRWMGRPPKVVPKAVHDELVKRKLSKAYDLLDESIYDAVAVL